MLSETIAATIARIHQKLADLKRWDTQYQLFGAKYHRYELAPPLDEATLAKLEMRFGIRFPIDYRAFLLHCGESGAGQGQGLLSPQSTLTPGLEQRLAREAEAVAVREQFLSEFAGKLRRFGGNHRQQLHELVVRAEAYLGAQVVQSYRDQLSDPVFSLASSPHRRWDGYLDLYHLGHGHYVKLQLERMVDPWNNVFPRPKSSQQDPEGRFLHHYEAWLDKGLAQVYKTLTLLLRQRPLDEFQYEDGGLNLAISIINTPKPRSLFGTPSSGVYAIGGQDQWYEEVIQAWWAIQPEPFDVQRVLWHQPEDIGRWMLITCTDTRLALLHRNDRAWRWIITNDIQDVLQHVDPTQSASILQVMQGSMYH